MKLEFKYTNELVNSLLKIEKYKTALDYLLLPTRERQKLMYEAKLKKTHFSTSIEGNVLSYNQVERVIANKKDNRITAEQEVQNYWDALTYLEEEKKKNTKIDMEFILKLHDIIQKKVNYQEYLLEDKLHQEYYFQYMILYQSKLNIFHLNG